MGAKSDVLIVGGGLSGSLLAWRLALNKPDISIKLIEAGKRLGGDQTWSFHESEISADTLAWIRPLLATSWSEANLRFPRLKRTLNGTHHAFRSEDLNREVREKLGSSVLFGHKAVRVSDAQVVLDNGDTLIGQCVLDARGRDKPPTPKLSGYMKFIALDILLNSPHGLSAPIVMDAICPQLDGLRFFSVLPWSDRKVTVRETCYSETGDLNSDRIRLSIQSYAERQGWKIAGFEREESGVVPIPMVSDYLAPGAAGEALPVGIRGGYYHALTGDVFVDATRNAEFISGLADPTTQSVRDALMRHRRSWLSRQRFYRLINRVMFYASEPSLRYQLFQSIYELPQDVIERLLAGRTSWGDRVRILRRRPPLPLERALRSLREKSMRLRFENEPSS